MEPPDDLTKAMRAVADANDEPRGVFTVDWNQPAPDGSGKPLIPNEVVHALVQHFDAHDLSNRSVPADVLGRAYEYLIRKCADDAGAKAGEFFTPPEVVDMGVDLQLACAAVTRWKRYEATGPEAEFEPGSRRRVLRKPVEPLEPEQIKKERSAQEADGTRAQVAAPGSEAGTGSRRVMAKVRRSAGVTRP